MDEKSKVLDRVRRLLDKAASTGFSAESDALRAKADQLMLTYAISQWELEQAKDENQRHLEPEIREMDVVQDYGNPYKTQLWDLFGSLVNHCRCRLASYRWRGTKVVGFPADLDYLQLLYTSLYLQFMGSLQPKVDPLLSDYENVTRLKQAGLVWSRIFQMMGTRDELGESKPCTKQERELMFGWRKWIKEQGREQDLMHFHPETYARSFAESFVGTVRHRLDQMKRMQERDDTTGSNALALRNLEDIVKEWMYDQGLMERPHPRDCSCERCHYIRCVDPKCQRPRCKEYNSRKYKPVKIKERAVSEAGMNAGYRAGMAADLSGGRGHIHGNKKELG